MHRLTLVGRPKTADKVKCLPAGDGLPIWSTLPLDAKIPMMENPKGSVVLYTTKLGEPKHRSKQEFDFDLRDPNGQYIRGEYEPLHDPHLKSYFSSRMMKRHLIRKGFISDDGKVLCSLKEFNYYRQYLRHLCFLEIANERKLQREKNKKYTARDGGEIGLDTRESRGTIVRSRLRKRRECDLASLNNRIREKSAQLGKRLQEIRGQMMERVSLQRERAKNRQHEIVRHQDEVASRGPTLLKRLRFRDQMKVKLINERELQRRLRAQSEVEDKWNLRKQIQKDRLEKTEEFMRREEEDRQKNTEKRARMTAKQRQNLDRKIEMFKVQMREQKQEREERCKKRLESRLASGDYRTWTKRKPRRRQQRPPFQSTCWKLDDVLRRLSASCLLPPTQRKPSFMVMLSAAIDEAVDIVTKPDDQVEAELQEKAKEIVEDVIARVKNEMYPAYLKMLEEEDSAADAEMSRSVRFVAEEEEIPISSVADEGSHQFRPVAEHILTPVPSQLEIQQIEAEAILGSPAFTDKTTSVSFVETLLLRLLDDLNSGRLTNDEIMKLASYSMEVLQSKESEAQKRVAIVEAEEEEPDIVSSSSSIIAKQMVDFTLGKILDEIKSGNIPESDIAALTRAVLGKPTEEEDVLSEGDLDEFIDDTIRECASRAHDTREDSPVCDALLDDFMVTTLQNLIKDLEDEVLTQEQLEALAKTVKEEAKDILPTESQAKIQDIQGIQNILQNILKQLQTGAVELHVLYQIVFAIVYSYNMLKSPPTPDFESKVTALMKELLFIVEQRANIEHRSDIDIELVHKASEQLSKTDLNVYQIEKLSSTILETVAKPDIICRTSTSEIARSIVEDALSKAKAKLLDEEEDPNLISGVQNIASAILSTQHEEQYGFSAVSDLLQDISELLKKNISSGAVQRQEEYKELEEIINLIDMRALSGDQLKEMAISVARVISSPLKTESSIMAEINTKDTLQIVREDLARGAVEEETLNQMIESMLNTHRVICATEALAPSMLNSLASFFKTVLGHVTYKVQCGEFSADDISELTSSFKTSFEKQTSRFEVPEIKPDELLHHLSKVTGDIERGVLNSRDANRFGKRLVECGNKIFSILSGASSAVSTPKSEEIAEGLVEEVIKALEEEIDSGLLTKESLKEITKTIISTTSETDTRLAEEAVGYTIRGIHRDVERGKQLPELPSITSLDHSPSASTIADHFVIETIDYINNYLKEEKSSPAVLISVATSLVSLISEERIEHLPDEFKAIKKTVQEIVQCLKKDAICQRDAEKIFCLVLDNYKDFVLRDKKQDSLPDSLPREDQELVRNLIDETLLNIQRSVAAGKLSKKNFSIPSSVAGSSTVYGDEIVELTMENVKKYFSAKSLPGSSTIYAHDIVDQTMKGIRMDQALGSEAGSTTVFASDIVDTLLNNLKEGETSKSDAGSTSIYANDIVNRALANITGGKVISDAGSTTLYAYDLVNLKLADIAAGIKTDAGSTTVYAYDLVNITLQNMKSSPDRVAISKSKDIVDFILQILDILADELSKGAISDLSMAHFFMVISGDTSDLHMLEINALSNLKLVRDDIEDRRNSSVYVQRILEAYLMPNNAVLEMFSDPVKAVESIMISVSSEILTKFVKATLQNILVEIREGNISLPEKAPSTFVLRSASSIVAENVIQEVVSRIKHDIAGSLVQPSKGTISKQEFERAASTLLGSPQVNGRVSELEKKTSDSKHSISSNMSREVEDVVLETVHNMVSNLRLEQSMYSQPSGEKSETHVSDEIQEFVLDSLQNIIADLQDKKALYELGLSKPHDTTADSAVNIHDTESRQTAVYVNEVLQSVIEDMRIEKSKYLTGEEKGTKSAENLETMILDCLQNAVSETVAPSAHYGLEPNQEDEIKRIVIETIKQTIEHINENKLDETDLTSLKQGLASIVNLEKECLSPEELIEVLENEIVRIEEEGLDKDTLGRISTQLATLGMENLALEENENKNLLSESTVSATSSLVSNLIQDVLSKLTKELRSEETDVKEKIGEQKQKVPSVPSSNSNTVKKDTNYNRRVSASSGNSFSLYRDTVVRKDLNSNRKISASSGQTQTSAATDISGFSETSDICLPDNSVKICDKQTIHYRLSQDKNIEKKTQSTPLLNSEISDCLTKTSCRVRGKEENVSVSKSVQPKKRVSQDSLKIDTKPFRYVENLHKQIKKPKSPANKFISGKSKVGNFNTDTKSTSKVTPKVNTSSKVLKSSPKIIMDLSTTKPLVVTGGNQLQPAKMKSSSIKKTLVSEKRKPQIQPAKHEKTNTLQRVQVEKKPCGRRSVPDSIYATKSIPKKGYEAPRTRQSFSIAYPSMKSKSTHVTVVSRDTPGKTIRKKSSGISVAKPTPQQENPHEIKSICGSHKTKLTLREPVWKSDPSEISTSENDYSYTSEIF